MTITLTAAMQAQDPAITGTYVWLGVAAIVLVLAALAFVYMLVRRSGLANRLAHLPILSMLDAFLSARTPSVWRFIRARFTIGQWHGLALTIGVTAAALGGYVFVLITESWMSEAALFLIDERVSSWLAESASAGTVELMRILTRFGDSEVVTALSVTIGLYLIYRRYAWHVLTLALAVGVGSAAVVGFKALFGRTRPGSDLAAELGHSFPSGHAFAAMSFYGLMIYLVWRHVRNDWIRVGATILFVVIILLVGASRVMLRVHWVSDVIGGFTLALAWLVCSIVLTYSLQSLIRPRLGGVRSDV